MPRVRIRWYGYIACAVIGCAAVWGIFTIAKPVDEVVLTLGESYEQVRQHSRSTLPPAEPNAAWGGYVLRPATFRFADAQFGFTTPRAKFLNVGYDKHGDVWSVSLSPQVETLPLDQSMAILTNLQDQFRRGGWKPFHTRNGRPIEDTQATRDAIRACSAPTTRWQAADKYQVALNIRCFRTDERPNDERYLITLDVSYPLFEDTQKGD